jgi:hypothetical protein
MQVGHIKANEIDTNDSTGKAILIRTAIAVHVDFLAGTIALSGARPRRRADVAQRFPEFEAAYMEEDFCAALA